jgi:hypothetical protein
MIPSFDEELVAFSVPDAENERTFLQLAVQAAAKKYRERHGGSPPSHASRFEHVVPQGPAPTGLQEASADSDGGRNPVRDVGSPAA